MGSKVDDPVQHTGAGLLVSVPISGFVPLVQPYRLLGVEIRVSGRDLEWADFGVERGSPAPRGEDDG